MKKNYTLLNVDGNAFSIMGYVARALKREGLEDKEEQYRREAMKGDYENLLSVSMDWIDDLNNGKLQKEQSEEKQSEAYKSNERLVQDFLKKHNLSDEAILGLEVFGQISDGEFEDCHSYNMDWRNCIHMLELNFPHCKDYTKEDLDEWGKCRKDLDFSPEGDFFEFEEGELDISKGYTASILPPSIKDRVLGVIESNIEEEEEEEEYEEEEEDEYDEDDERDDDPWER